jgi:hypothetical protein
MSSPARRTDTAGPDEDRLGDRADFEPQDQRLARAHCHVHGFADRPPEAGQLRRHGIAAGGQQHDEILAEAIGGRTAREGGVHVDHGDGGARYDRATRIVDASGDFTGRGLRGDARRREGKQQD